MKKNNRRQYLKYPFLQPQLQFKIAFLFVGIGTINAIYFSLLFFLSSREFFFANAALLPDDLLSGELLKAQLWQWGKMIFFILIPEIFLVLVFGLYFSHRITGPLHAVSTRLKQIANGRIPSPVGVRKKYFLAEMANEMNATISHLALTQKEIDLAAQEAARGEWDNVKKRLEELAASHDPI